MTQKNYIPALSFNWLTRFYDPLIRWTMPEARFKQALIGQLDLQDGQRVLDLGCGTGTLLIMLKQSHPDIEAVGIDGDPTILEIARAKFKRMGLEIALHEGLAASLPFPDAHFDRVATSLVLHHLTSKEKLRALREARRILRTGGELHVADFGKPHNFLMRALSLVIQSLEHSTDNIKGRLPDLMRESGFDLVEETGRHSTMFGTLSRYKARKPLEN